MNYPDNLKYSKSHEWVKFIDDSTVQIGLTDYAQDAMGDIIFTNLPVEEDEVTIGEPFADVESVKSVSDVFSPVTGIVETVNELLLDTPEEINKDPYEAWLIQVKDVSETEDLLTAEEYKKLCDEEA